MRTLLIAAFAAFLIAPAFADSANDTAVVTLTIDSACEVDLGAMVSPWTLDAHAVKNQTLVTTTVPITARANAAASIAISATDLTGPGGTFAPNPNPAGSVLNYSVSPYGTGAIAVTAGVPYSGNITVGAQTGPDWEDALAGTYTSTITATITAS